MSIILETGSCKSGMRERSFSSLPLGPISFDCAFSSAWGGKDWGGVCPGAVSLHLQVRAYRRGGQEGQEEMC